MKSIYEKVGKRYRKLPWSDWHGFPCDGIFLVTTPDSKGEKYKNASGYSCILKVGELPDLYPFAQMAVSKDELANFIGKWREEQKENNPQHDKKGNLISWTVKSNSDFAGDILKFLASLNAN